ncbi:MAG: hypothetical protein IKM13_02750 [Clostridia bacterium]|nr:hypothetical protein [Clostridia bacterium]
MKYMELLPLRILVGEAEYMPEELSLQSCREVRDLGNGLYEICDSVKNVGEKACRFATMVEAKTNYCPTHTVIPCVSYNGNEFGKGLEPKGLTRDGKPWVFAYDREGIPACTLCEDEKNATAMFAATTDETSLVSACSLVKTETGMCHRVIRPDRETPVCYIGRDEYDEGYIKNFTLAPGESLSHTTLVWEGEPKWENFGMASLMDRIVVYYDIKREEAPDFHTLWKAGIAYAKRLLTNCEGKGHRAFIIGLIPDDKDGFVYRGDRLYELGWCGQNALYARMFIRNGIKYGETADLEAGLEVLDGFVERCTFENGLYTVNLRLGRDKDATSDVCNLGWGAYELLLTYRMLKEVGIEREGYKTCALRLCDFFTEHYSDEFGFGKSWTMDGKCVDQGGSIGGFLLPAFLEAYRETREEAYLETAEKAFSFYAERDLDKFACSAGALDTVCVDKETSMPFIRAAVQLYDVTGKQEYLTYARKAAYYFLSWMYFYDALYDPETDFAVYGYHTKGGTSVSAQHHHIDPYGAMIVPDLVKLSDLTGEDFWRCASIWILKNASLLLSDGKTPIRGRVRPYGGQNEAFLHCRWGQPDYKKSADQIRGTINDWLVAWPSAFRLGAVADMEDLNLSF